MPSAQPVKLSYHHTIAKQESRRASRFSCLASRIRLIAASKTHYLVKRLERTVSDVIRPREFTEVHSPLDAQAVERWPGRSNPLDR